MKRKNPPSTSPTNINEKRLHLAQGISQLDLTALQDSALPDPVKALMHQVVDLLKLAGELLTDQCAQKDDDDRLRTVVLSNMPESDAERPVDRARQDVARVQDVLNECGLDACLPAAVTRLGKRQPNRHRPIKVQLPSQGAAMHVLRNRLKVREGTFKEVRIREEMTPEQRKERSRLIQECIKKRSESNEDFIVYANSIILRSDIPNFIKYKLHDTPPKSQRFVLKLARDPDTPSNRWQIRTELSFARNPVSSPQ